MHAQTGCVTSLQQALARADRDADFRAQVLEEGRLVQHAYRLADAEWHVLFTVVCVIEQSVADDPGVATEVDHGEADAAGVKG